MAILPVGISGEAQYQISRSLRFNSSDSAFMSRTPGSAGNRKTWTWSGWVKRVVASGSDSNVFFGGDSTNGFGLYLNSSGIISLGVRVSSVSNYINGTAVYRDASAWYHIVCTLDTTQATASNRVKVYINGVQDTTIANSTQISQNQDLAWNNNVAQYLGYNSWFGSYSNMYLTEVNCIDGQALTPSSFGETDPITGVWKPKKYTGTYGTNGFYLNFSDNSGATATTLGKDSSGNGNNWTPNNFSVTAGAGNDSLVDVPTLWGSDTGAGGEVRGNYATLNPLAKGNVTLTNGNLDFSIAASGGGIQGTMAVSSGKWYYEVTHTSGSALAIGFINASKPHTVSVFSDAGPSAFFYGNSTGNEGEKIINGVRTSGYSQGTEATATCAMALDLDNNMVYAYRNNSLVWSASITAGTTWIPMLANGSSGEAQVGSVNFGQRPFQYTAPSGFKALCTTNLPEPSIKQGDDYFNAVTYTGNATTGRQVTGVGFQPDFIWIKNRSAATDNYLYDVIRGAGYGLYSNLTSQEVFESNQLSAINSDGFTVNTAQATNGNTNALVAWNWKANGAGVTNTAGTITSTVSANTTSGFSVVTWAGNSTAGATVGHGLGVTPSMIIIKNRTNGSTYWSTYHKSLSSGYNVNLNETSAAFQPATGSGGGGVGTSPSSTTFGFIQGTSNLNNVNATSSNYVAYCFAEVAGFSRFGSYTGNGSTDGPFVFCGFRPRYVMYKRTATGGNWYVYDTARSVGNGGGLDAYLFPNLANAENSDGAFTSTEDIDLLSNGFKIRDGGGDVNNNGEVYIFAAFAENPFKYSLAR